MQKQIFALLIIMISLSICPDQIKADSHDQSDAIQGKLKSGETVSDSHLLNRKVIY